MNKVLSVLLLFVFLQTQAWALSGGPNYTGSSGTTNLIGTYAGVLTGPPNALGIFIVGIPDVGPATGDCSIFIAGAFYGGSIIGIGDPQNASFRGVIDTQRLSSVTTFVTIFGTAGGGAGTVQGIASGLVDATIIQEGGIGAGLAGTRLIGTAHVDAREFDPGTTTTTVPGTGTGGTTTTTGGKYKLVGSEDFVVDGFKQSDQGNAQQAQLLQGFGASGGAAVP